MKSRLLLTKTAYRDAISSVNPTKVAVAYIGKDYDEYLEINNLKEIIISPTLGSNPHAVKNLISRLSWENIFFLDNLHAKIYLGTESAVIGSANLTNNGLGDIGLIEIGTQITDSALLVELHRKFGEMKILAKKQYPDIKSKNNKLENLFEQHNSFDLFYKKNKLGISDKLFFDKTTDEQQKDVYVVIKENWILSSKELVWDKIDSLKEPSWVYQVKGALKIIDPCLKQSKLNYHYISWEDFRKKNFQDNSTLIISHREITGQGISIKKYTDKIKQLANNGVNLILLQGFSDHLYHIKNDYWSYCPNTKGKVSPRLGESSSYKLNLVSNNSDIDKKLNLFIDSLSQNNEKEGFSWKAVDKSKFDILIEKESINTGKFIPNCISFGNFKNPNGGYTFLIHISNVGKTKLKENYFKYLFLFCLENVIKKNI